MRNLLNILVFSTLFLGFTSFASTKYVSDILYVPLKKNGASGPVLKHLKSGTVVTVLEGKDGDYVEVKVQDGNKSVGWVKSRYLLNTPIAKMELGQLKETLKNLQSKQEPLAATVVKLKKNIEILKHKNASLVDQKNILQQKISKIKEATSDTLAVHQKNEALLKEQKVIKEKYATLQKENLSLVNNQRNEGIKLGLLAVAIGAFAGFLLPYVKPRGRRHKGVRLR